MRQLLEVIRASDEVRLAVHLHHRGHASAGVDIALDQALGGLAVRPLFGQLDPAFLEQECGPLLVAFRLLKSALALHDAGAGALAQFLHLGGRDGGLVAHPAVPSSSALAEISCRGPSADPLPPAGPEACTPADRSQPFRAGASLTAPAPGPG